MPECTWRPVIVQLRLSVRTVPDQAAAARRTPAGRPGRPDSRAPALGDRVELEPMAVRHAPGVPAGRQAEDLRRVRADEADAGRRQPLQPGRVEALGLAGSSACCPDRPASTGRSCRRVRTTRWQGTMSGTGLWPSADPTARTALGRPISAAIQPYGRTSPRGISSAFVPDVALELGVAAQVEVDAHAPVAVQPPSDRPWPAGRQRSAGNARRPVRAVWRASNGVIVGPASTTETPSPFQATTSGPIGESNRAYRSARPTSTSTAGRSVAGRGRQQPGQRGLDVGRWWSCGHLLALAPLRRPRTPSATGPGPRWTWALTVPSGRSEGGGGLGIGQAVDVAQHDGAPVGGRQRQQQVGPARRPHR